MARPVTSWSLALKNYESLIRLSERLIYLTIETKFAALTIMVCKQLFIEQYQR